LKRRGKRRMIRKKRHGLGKDIDHGLRKYMG
jgi:hypothetical protein